MKFLLKMSSILSCKRAVTAIEFAIIFPVVLFFTFGVMLASINYGKIIQLQDIAHKVQRQLLISDDIANIDDFLEVAREEKDKRLIEQGYYLLGSEDVIISKNSENTGLVISYILEVPLFKDTFGLGIFDWGLVEIPINYTSF
jgi:hypothetical protein